MSTYFLFNDTHSSHCASRQVSHRVLSVSLANDPKSILRYLVFFASTCRCPSFPSPHASLRRDHASSKICKRCLFL